MRVYGDLNLNLNGRTFADVVEEIDRHLAGHWQRNREREQEVDRMGVGTQICYRFSEGNAFDLPGTDLWLYHDAEDNEAHVSNIVPIRRGHLTHEQYNSILTIFHNELLQVAARNLGLAAILSKTGEVGIEDFVKPATAKALRRFSVSANKSTGASHPLDRQRWFDFVITCHHQADDLPTDILEEWLIEDGWDEESARELVIQLEQQRGLLEWYDTRAS